jgi:chaperonin cofactor prefoldin
LPVADESVTDELKKQISDLDMRLKEVEGQLSKVQINNSDVSPKITSKEK